MASVPGRVGTIGAVLRLMFACQGAAGQTCQGQASVSAIEKLSADGKRIPGVLSSVLRTGRTGVVVVANGNLSARAGGGSEVSISLDASGWMLRSRFKNLLAGHITTIKTIKVSFGPETPEVSIAGSQSGTTLAFR